MLRTLTFWFVSVWLAFWASIDFMLICDGKEPGKHAFFLLMTVLLELMVIRRWGPKEPEAETVKPRDEEPPGPPGTV